MEIMLSDLVKLLRKSGLITPLTTRTPLLGPPPMTRKSTIPLPCVPDYNGPCDNAQSPEGIHMSSKDLHSTPRCFKTVCADGMLVQRVHREMPLTILIQFQDWISLMAAHPLTLECPMESTLATCVSCSPKHVSPCN